MEALIGEHVARQADSIMIDGKPVGRLGPTERRALGMCFVPEERLGHGAVPEMSLWENGVLTARSRMGFMSYGFLNMGKPRTFADRVVGEFGVRTAGIDHAARSLSGGNLQKFVMGARSCRRPRC